MRKRLGWGGYKPLGHGVFFLDKKKWSIRLYRIENKKEQKVTLQKVEAMFTFLPQPHQPLVLGLDIVSR